MVDDTVVVFDHYEDKLYRFDKDNNLIDSAAISYHKTRKRLEWRKEMVMDDEEGHVYAIFLIDGYHHLKKINTHTGEVVETFKFAFKYAERIQVKGERTGSGFSLVNADGQAELPECVMTFAYWNPAFLEQSRLLNPQTGEFVDVQVEEVGSETLEVRGEAVAATRFKLTAYEIDLTLWYSPNDEWLALESVAKGGHIIRYELS